MCVIIAKPATATHPTMEIIDACWARNPDGAGFSYINVNHGVSIVKGLMTLEALKAALAPLLAVESCTYLLHFRIGTHGGNTEVNTHPFWAKENKVAFVHNGILPMSRHDALLGVRSDTRAFVEDIVSTFPEDWHRRPAFQHLVEEYMGSNNKVAAIDKDGIVLLNDAAWALDKASGLHYSNMHWKAQKVTQFSSYYGLPAYYNDDYPGHGYVPVTAPAKPPQLTKPTMPGLLASQPYKRAISRFLTFVREDNDIAVLMGAVNSLLIDYSVTPEEVDVFLDYGYSQRALNKRLGIPPLSYAQLLDTLHAQTLLEAIESAGVLEDLKGQHIIVA